MNQHKVRDKQMTRGPITWIRLGILSSPDYCLSGSQGRTAGGWYHGTGNLLQGNLARERIGLGVLGARAVVDAKVELAKEQGSVCLARI